jgi:8-oxo-dGTP pyrophosphatase MutT (NUDIX family)
VTQTQSQTEKPLTPSASILLVRDGAQGLEVFMVKRHYQIDYAAGALVFPGGKIDPGDAAPELAAHCVGLDGLDDAMRAITIGAIREAFEECGMLIAREKGTSGLLGGARQARLAADYRVALHDGAASLLEIVTRENLVLACDELARFAHWVTPRFMPRRFSTFFFLARAPLDHTARHDGSESIDSLWVRPADALAQAEAGEATVVFPTRLNLELLGRSATVADALTAARARPPVTVEPMESEPGIVTIPPEAGYAVSRVPIEQVTGSFAKK